MVAGALGLPSPGSAPSTLPLLSLRDFFACTVALSRSVCRPMRFRSFCRLASYVRCRTSSVSTTRSSRPYQAKGIHPYARSSQKDTPA